MPPLPGIRVVLSKIHGYGGIATRPFKAGEIAVYGDGVLYQQTDDFDDTYALIMDGKHGETVLFDLADQTRWFNHACDPNTEVCSAWDHETDSMKAWWLCLRDIAVGEEITYDYGFAAEVAEPCHCGAASCRGVIVDEDPAVQAQLSPQLRALLKSRAA
jgi:hypothetical protein